MDRQADRQIKIQTDRNKDTHIEKQTYKWTYRQVDKPTDRWMDRQLCGQFCGLVSLGGVGRSLVRPFEMGWVGLWSGHLRWCLWSGQIRWVGCGVFGQVRWGRLVMLTDRTFHRPCIWSILQNNCYSFIPLTKTFLTDFNWYLFLK